MAILAGRATPEATLGLARQAQADHGYAPEAYRPLGRTELMCAMVGFGGYRVDRQTPEHRAALELALTRGVNLIDTSSNYTDGESESLIGEVLGERPDQRARVILVSKVGYVQGNNMAVVKKAIARGRPFSEMVEYQPECWHCIHPDFIADQLERSLTRLRVSILDVYLLHNPEYFFSDRLHRDGREGLEEAREEFYRRIEDAFGFLERTVAEGRLQWYGVSSNTFGKEAAHPEFVSLERLQEAAAKAAAAHGSGDGSRFAVVQCPLNLREGGPALTRNQRGGGTTFLELAAELGLGVLVNRPLNAIVGGRMERLAGIPAPRPNLEEAIEAAFGALERHEATLREGFRQAADQGGGALDQLAGWFGLHETLERIYRSHPPREAWLEMVDHQVRPGLHGAATAMAEVLAEPDREEFFREAQAHRAAVEAVAELAAEALGKDAHERTRALEERLAALLAEDGAILPLSRQALRLVAAQPAVSCVLTGIRRPAYVEDATAAMTGALPDSHAALRGLREFHAKSE